MTVAAVTPPDAASDPKHPDHDRWVKDRTLKMEIEHAQLVGLTLRDAETENARQLARAEMKSKDAHPVITKPLRQARENRHADRGISRKAPKKPNKKPECTCGTCVPCRRKMRVLALYQGRANPSLKQLSDDISAALVASIFGKGAFAGLRPKDAQRALAAKIDRICDASVFLMGTWR